MLIFVFITIFITAKLQNNIPYIEKQFLTEKKNHAPYFLRPNNNLLFMAVLYGTLRYFTSSKSGFPLTKKLIFQIMKN